VRIRRSERLAFRAETYPIPDIARFLRGEAAVTRAERLLAASAGTGEEHPISREQLAALLDVPAARWIEPDVAGLDEGTAAVLARHGWLLREDDDSARARDEAPSSARWNPYAAIYHALTRWRGVQTRDELPVAAESAATVERRAERLRSYGTPPPVFHDRRGRASVELPVPEGDGELRRALLERRTTRAFDRRSSLPTAALGTVLYYGFGCQGVARVSDELELMRRASPSGGGMHPIEAYPLVLRAEGVDPGLYHYRPRDHGLELLERLDEDDARGLALSFVAGQEYFVDAQALVVLTARFERTFWRYRDNDRAFSVVLMDAAHISQTLYLVSAELGLGAFVTAAVNAADIDDALGLDGFHEGTVAVCGFGVRSTARPGLEPDFEPYAPDRA
jgi:putative peptide maturation dehydrogenase